MNDVIAFYNNAVYSLSAVVLLSTLVKSKKRRYIVTFIAVAAIGLLLTSTLNLIMPATIVSLTLCFIRRRSDICRTFYLCLTVIFLLFCGILIVSSPIMLIAQDWHNSIGFNALIGGVLLVAVITVKAKEEVMYWLRDFEHEGYVIVLELVLLLFFCLSYHAITRTLPMAMLENGVYFCYPLFLY